MIRTNSKAAIEKIRKILIDCNDFAIDCGYNFESTTDWKEAAKNIYNAFYIEKAKYDNRNMSMTNLFIDWMSGLPTACSVSDDIFLGSAVDFLGDILEQTQEERSKYTEEQAERTACLMIYREIEKATR